jgi:hypothetical protein
MSTPTQRIICVADSAIAVAADARDGAAIALSAIGPVLVRPTGTAIPGEWVTGVGSLKWLSYDGPALSTAGCLENRGRTCG